MIPRRPIALDTNLAVLLVVGATNPAWIRQRGRRADMFDEKDFDALEQIIDHAGSIVWCPNVLTETSNLLRRAEDENGRRIIATLTKVIEAWHEQTITSRDAVSRAEFRRLGLTDSVLLLLAKSGATLLTVDAKLHVAALQAGYHSVNFRHVQERLNFS